mmetsp:Transcript_15118/g.38709  ORF Transcript_15118/g.38709 Transcript_15118/m.38709 type:complete len:169 (-) Transcript_15118:56-562(-)
MNPDYQAAKNTHPPNNPFSRNSSTLDRANTAAMTDASSGSFLWRTHRDGITMEDLLDEIDADPSDPSDPDGGTRELGGDGRAMSGVAGVGGAAQPHQSRGTNAGPFTYTRENSRFGGDAALQVVLPAEREEGPAVIRMKSFGEGYFCIVEMTKSKRWRVDRVLTHRLS